MPSRGYSLIVHLFTLVMNYMYKSAKSLSQINHFITQYIVYTVNGQRLQQFHVTVVVTRFQLEMLIVLSHLLAQRGQHSMACGNMVSHHAVRM